MDNFINQFANIKKISILNNLLDNEIHELLEFATLHTFAPGQVVFYENEPGTSVFMVISGVIKIFKNTPDGSSIEIAQINETEFFGEMSFLDGRLRSANAMAAFETYMISIDEDNFKRFSARYANAAFRFLKNITLEIQRRIRQSNEKLAQNYDALLKVHNELSENRNFLYNIIGNSAEIIFVLDAMENVIIFNHGAEDTLKIRIGDILGKRLDFIFIDNQLRELLNEIAINKNIYNRDVYLKTFEGKKILTNMSGFMLSGMRDRKFCVDGIVFIAHNVTEKRMLERQLVQNEKMILLGKIVADIIHNIKNPLTVIALAKDCLSFKAEEHKDEELKKEAREISSAVDKIQNAITNTLSLAKVVPNSKEIVNVCEIIDRAIRNSKNHIKLKKIDIYFKPAVTVGNIFGNAAQLEQVFMNLITNSIHAIPANKNGVISIDLKKNDRTLVIAIKDNGIGMSEDTVSKIFDSFFTTSAEGESTGLGLSVCQAILSQHEAEICCESKPGEGTTFFVNFPVR